jgi:hypothetical protein
VAKLADAADLGSLEAEPESPNTEKTSPIGDPRSTEIAPEQGGVWQRSGNPECMNELEGAIARVTRAIAAAGEDVDVAELVAERKAMRVELESLRRTGAGVVDIETARRR